MSPKSNRFAQEIGRSAVLVAAQSLLFIFFVATLAYGVSPVASDRGPGTIQISSNLPPATALKPYNAVLAVTGGQSPYRFAVNAGRLPNGLGLNPLTGSITGAAMVPGTYGFTVSVSDHAGGYGRQSMLLQVAGSKPGEIRVSVSPTGGSVSSGTTQQFTATVTGTSQTAVSWVATNGVINSSGLFTAPSVTANTNVTVTAISVANPASKGSAILTVTAPSGPPPSLSITSTALPPATVGSSYVAGLYASGGTQPYQWTLTGSLPSGMQFNASTATLTGTTNQQGQFPLVATVTDAASHSATQPLTLSVSTQVPGTFDGPAELPRVYIQSTLANTPAPGSTISVPAGGNLQAALNSANCGDTISLAPGATFAGIFTFPAKSCDNQHWIIVRTGAPDTSLPPEGTRLTPCYAGVSSLPGRPALNCTSTQNVMPKLVFNQKIGDGPIVLANGANHYRFLGLEITRQVGGLIVFHLVSLTPGGTADHIIFDRVWIHGTAQDETKSGIGTSGTTNLAVVDSYFNDLHCIALSGACTDGNAIGGGNGNNPMGPYKIVNNFLEAGGQSIIFGGGAATQTPADIEIRRNHLYKPLAWLKGQPGFMGAANGNPFIVKNNFELKNAQRVLFEGNVLEYSWGGFTQNGFSILLTPRNQQVASGANVCPLCQITDVTIRYNTISHAGAGMQITNGLTGPQGPLAGQRYSIHDVIIDDIDGIKYNGSGNLMQVGTGPVPSPILQNVVINHVTGLVRGAVLMVGGRNPAALMPNFTYTNNLLAAGPYHIYSTGGAVNCANNKNPINILNACFGPYVFAGNAIYGNGTQYGPTSYPTRNIMLPNIAVEFVNYSNGNGGDYHLVPTSPLKNAGTDGKDIGADVNTVQAVTAGVP